MKAFKGLTTDPIFGLALLTCQQEGSIPDYSHALKMKYLTAILITAACTSQCTSGQTLINLKTQTRDVDFSAAPFTRPVKVGTALPVTCGLGDLYFKSDMTPGGNLYGCTASNTWTQISSSSGAGSGGTYSAGLGFLLTGNAFSADFSVLPGLAVSNTWSNLNDFSMGTMRVPVGLGVPASSTCAGASNVGSVYVRSDAQTSNASNYICSQTGVGVYSWELTQGAGGSSSSSSYSGCSGVSNGISCAGPLVAGLGSGVAGGFNMFDTRGVNYIGLASPSTVPATYTLQLPTAQPSAGQFLQFTAPSGGVATGSWVTAGASSPLTTKGDLYVYGSTGTRLPIGADTYVLTADSTQTLGMKWAPSTGSSNGAGSPVRFNTFPFGLMNTTQGLTAALGAAKTQTCGAFQVDPPGRLIGSFSAYVSTDAGHYAFGVIDYDGNVLGTTNTISSGGGAGIKTFTLSSPITLSATGSTVMANTYAICWTSDSTATSFYIAGAFDAMLSSANTTGSAAASYLFTCTNPATYTGNIATLQACGTKLPATGAANVMPALAVY